MKQRTILLETVIIKATNSKTVVLVNIPDTSDPPISESCDPPIPGIV
jgi:hypothetical protein